MPLLRLTGVRTMPKTKKRTPTEKAALTKQEREELQSLARGMPPYHAPLMLSGMPDPVGPPEDYDRFSKRLRDAYLTGRREDFYGLLADRYRRESPEDRTLYIPGSEYMEPPLYGPKYGGTKEENERNIEYLRRRLYERVLESQGDYRPGKDHSPWDGINYPISEMKERIRPEMWTEDPTKHFPRLLRRQRKHQAPRPRQPRPSDAEFLKMWEEKNRMLQEQRKRAAERRMFEEDRPMLPSGASDIRRFPVE